jgi:hypothetical protein
LLKEAVEAGAATAALLLTDTLGSILLTSTLTGEPLDTDTLGIALERSIDLDTLPTAALTDLLTSTDLVACFTAIPKSKS